MKLMSRKQNGLTGSQSGQALVELALVAPVLLVLVLGIADFCRVFYASITVTNAARAGAQFGLRGQNYTLTTGTPSMQSAAVADVTASGQPLLPGFSAANVTATYYCRCPNGTNPIGAKYDKCAGMPAPGKQCGITAAPITPTGVWVDVTVNYTFRTITSFPGIPHSVPLVGEAQMRVQ
jgi:Flp pilus assembly protein TadG